MKLDSKKKKLIILIAGIVLLMTLGASYAWFSYTRVGSTNRLIVGDIYLSLDEYGDSISLTNVLPESKEEARASNKNFIIFTVSGVNTSDRALYYEFFLKYGDNLSGAYKRFRDSDLRFDLVELDSNNNELSYIISDQSFSSINNNRIYVDTVPAGTSTDIIRRYKLRMWLSENVLISDTDPRASYPATGENGFYNRYATVRLGVNGDFVVKTAPSNLYSEITSLASSKNYINVYSGNHNDTLYDVDTNSIYYYSGSEAANNNNVLFGGFCWQIVRTTDNGGIKLLYNGPASNKQCGDSRNAAVGIIGHDGEQSRDLNQLYTYGKSFNYDTTTNTFTLSDTFNKTYSDSTYKEITGTYTCLNVSPCTTIYYIGQHQDSTHASAVSYTIGSSLHYTEIGSSPFNASSDSPAMVGYMYDDIYNSKTGLKSGTHLYGSDITYDKVNDVYTVNSTVSSLDDTHHYTCNTDVSEEVTCSSIRYYYRTVTDNNTTTYYYIVLENGDKITDALKNMLNKKTNINDTDANINKYNSAIKGVIDNWYRHNLENYSNYLDVNTVYCNLRGINDLAGWSNNGTLTDYMKFSNNTSNTNLSCSNTTDSFSGQNAKAKLSYPIGLLTASEYQLIGADYISNGTHSLWLISPKYYKSSLAKVVTINNQGIASDSEVELNNAIRPVITLKSNTTIIGGDGTKLAPYIIN